MPTRRKRRGMIHRARQNGSDISGGYPSGDGADLINRLRRVRLPGLQFRNEITNLIGELFTEVNDEADTAIRSEIIVWSEDHKLRTLDAPIRLM